MSSAFILSPTTALSASLILSHILSFLELSSLLQLLSCPHTVKYGPIIVSNTLVLCIYNL
jgi:hypothetical protein